MRAAANVYVKTLILRRSARFWPVRSTAFFWLARGVALGMARAWAACSVLHLRCKIASEIRAVLHLRLVFARFGDEGSGFSTTKPSASRASCFNDENDDDF